MSITLSKGELTKCLEQKEHHLAKYLPLHTGQCCQNNNMSVAKVPGQTFSFIIITYFIISYCNISYCIIAYSIRSVCYLLLNYCLFSAWFVPTCFSSSFWCFTLQVVQNILDTERAHVSELQVSPHYFIFWIHVCTLPLIHLLNMF